jgi:hypothetical protein
MPDHLTFLRTYFRRGPVNALFPLAMVLAILATASLFETALAPGASETTRVGSTLLGALLALAILEHAFMLVRLPIESLWRWSRGQQVQSAAADGNSSAEILRREQPRDLGDIKSVLPTIP